MAIASCGALHYAKILTSLKIKNAFTFALNDSADALVERCQSYRR